MINKQLILEKLGINKEISIHNILMDEKLCERILKERPIKLSAFENKQLVSNSLLKKMIKEGLISVFSNSEHSRSSKYIFENELELFLIQSENLVYDRSIIPNIKKIGLLIVNVLSRSLKEREQDLLKVYMLHMGDSNEMDKFVDKYKITKFRAAQLFESVMHKVRRNNFLYDRFLDDLTIERDMLLDEIKNLRQLSDTLHIRNIRLLEGHDKRMEIENLSIFSKSFHDLGFRMRSANCLLSNNISTMKQLLEYSPQTIMGFRNVGVSTIKDIQKVLAQYGYKLKDDEI